MGACQEKGGLCFYWGVDTPIKKLLKWANRKYKYFNIYKNEKKNKKIKKNTWRYHYFIPVYQQSSWYDLQFLRYGVWQTEIGNYGSFFTLLPSPIKPKKIWILKKLRILLEISPFYTSVPKATIIWGTVPEIWSETAKILSFWAIF